jgi:hypothetical protein
MSLGYSEPKYDTIWSTATRTTTIVKTHFLKELSYEPKVTTKITPGVQTLIPKENIPSPKRQQHKPHKSLLSNLVRAQDKVSHT